jgi:hypothetical protein
MERRRFYAADPARAGAAVLKWLDRGRSLRAWVRSAPLSVDPVLNAYLDGIRDLVVATGYAEKRTVGGVVYYRLTRAGRAARAEPEPAP